MKKKAKNYEGISPHDFKKSMLSVGVATALMSGGVCAQSEAIEEIVVTGMLSTMKAATARKRDSSGMMDAILAEDIGKFPDTNLAESLQRIPGVAISRSNGEGNQITVRGMGPQFNFVTLNGRQMPNTNANRAYRFSDILPEMVTGVEVHKTATATKPSGGIGALVDIQTATPMQIGDRTSGSVKMLFDDYAGSTTPQFSGLMSKMLSDNFGILVSAGFQNRETENDFVQVREWRRFNNLRVDVNGDGVVDPDTEYGIATADGRPWYVPIQSITGHEERDRDRKNANLVMQYQANDRMTATFDYQMSEFTDDYTQLESAIWFGNFNGAQAGWTYDENNTVTSATFPNKGVDFFSANPKLAVENESVGLSLDMDINEDSSVSVSYSSSSSERQPGNLDQRNKADIQITGLEPVFGINGDFAAPVIERSTMLEQNYRVHQHTKQVQNLSDEIDQLKLDYQFDNGGLFSVKAGVMYTDQTKDNYPMSARPNGQLMRDTDINGDGVNDDGSNNGRTMVCEIYDQDGDRAFALNDQGGWAMTGACDAADIAAMQADYQQVSFNNPFVQGSANFVDYSTSMSNTWLAHRGLPSNYLDLVYESSWYDINEETTAFYVEAKSEGLEVGGRPLEVVLGYRHESTDIESTSEEVNLTGYVAAGIGEPMGKVEDGSINFTDSASYDMGLHNLSLRYQLNDQTILRLAHSETITRPNLASMRSARNLAGDVRDEAGTGGQASAGNPGLLPFTSTNIDVGVEYYLDDFSYFSAAYFKKTVDNFVSNTVTQENLTTASGATLSYPTDVLTPGIGGTAILYNVTRPSNNDVAEVDGWEIAASYLFGDSGFGVSANMTLVETDATFDATNIATTFALSGVGDSWNMIGFYEKGPIQARVAYNFRDSFFERFGQNDRNTTEPTIFDEYGQLDISASYDYSDSITILFEGVNITSEDLRARGRYANHMSNVATGSARYAVGVRAKF
ncbi:MAG: hypothetical protein CBB97_17045 [Candidatus Endolissoclinum sp. TMED37]|nr:MAG: hypothetical protein CBB97_20760 [Candidatus Endolissoclinum sp. TMED37]OUU20876.1 MAG: hypothetical protein CBB97_17045 [Candidatus Endolissoclinum sp. TMED37]|tara:strand:+ start:4771 stop:7674 length:2904 start_codon:yes stop_codon:yes gene_type:complete